jgi:hypothetical protein
MSETNGWTKYEQLVLFRLDQQDRKLDTMAKDIQQLTESVMLLKFKAAVLGTIGGAITSAMVASVVEWWFRK